MIETSNKFLAAYFLLKMELKEVTPDDKNKKVIFVFENPNGTDYEKAYYSNSSESMVFSKDLMNSYLNVQEMIWKVRRERWQKKEKVAS
jgi:hypothetical protein